MPSDALNTDAVAFDSCDSAVAQTLSLDFPEPPHVSVELSLTPIHAPDTPLFLQLHTLLV